MSREMCYDEGTQPYPLSGILEKIRAADMVLVGVGEEFDGERQLRQEEEYRLLRQELEGTEEAWWIPALNRYYSEKGSRPGVGSEAFKKLAELIQGKNYFVVCVATNDYIWESGLKQDRIVAPCGGSRKKQCSGHRSCSASLRQKGISPEAPRLLSGEEKENLKKCVEKRDWKHPGLGNCSYCGAPMVLNNVYTGQYDEEGYLDQWKIYTKWLQGTVNRRLCILELGVGLQCPGVIRFPFEKIGYYNLKSDFIRVHEKLYQLTEGIAERGISVPENAVSWLNGLCFYCL